MARRNISSGSKFEAEIGYSRAVATGSWVFVSGTTGCVFYVFYFLVYITDISRYNYDTGVISPSIVDQAEQTLKNIEAALKEAGASMHDVVKVRYILPDGKEFPSIWPVLKKYFGDVRPAATMVQADLMEKVMKVEIEVTAKKAEESKARL